MLLDGARKNDDIVDIDRNKLPQMCSEELLHAIFFFKKAGDVIKLIVL